MNIFKILLTILFLQNAADIKACACAELHPLTLADCGRYEVIFEGKIDSVSKCKNEKALTYFSITQQFKGNFLSIVPVYFECGTSCEMDFQKGDTWIIYAEKNNAQEVVVNFCSRSRKEPLPGQTDNYTYNSIHSYAQERTLLNEFFEGEENEKQGLQARKYEKVDPSLIPILLTASVAFMAIGMYLFRRKKK